MIGKLKYAMLLVGLVGLSIMVAACGMSGGAGSDDNANPQQGEIEGEITFQTLQLKPTFNDYINGVISDFENQHEGVTVTWEDIPFEGAAQKVIADSSAGQLPDVINLNPDFALPLAQNGVFINMDEAASDVKDRYTEGAWQAFEYPSLGSGVALPWYLSIELTLYNGNYYEQAGLDPNEAPTTFDELYANASQVAEETDHFGIHPAPENRFLIDLAKQGVPIVNEQGTEATFNTPKAVSFLERQVELYEQGVMPPDSPTETHRDEIDAYQSGQIAILPSGPNFLGIIEENAPEVYETTRVGPQVTGETDVPNMSVMGIFVPQSSENQATALAFAKFMTNAENQLAFSKEVTVLPSTSSSLDNPYFTDVEGNDPEAVARRISAEQIKNAEVLRPPMVSDEFNQAVVNSVQAALLGDLSPQEALDQAAEEATVTLEQGGS